MSKEKNSSGASQPNGYESPTILSTDIYLNHLGENMYGIQKDIVGKMLTFIEAISDNEQLAKSRKDVVSDILYNELQRMIRQPQNEMELLDRSVYDEETLKKNRRGSQYKFMLVSTRSEDYDKDYVVKPGKI